MKLLFIGDLCVSKQNAPELGESISNLFSSADIICANFEAPIIQLGTRAAPKAGPSIHQTEQVLGLLEKCGITHLTLANNHIMDYGESGLRYTLDKLNRYTIHGAGVTFEDAYRPIFHQQDGCKIALLAFGEAQFGALGMEPFQQAGFARVDTPLARQAVINASQEADWVIVQIHAGLEMVDIPLPEWRERFREFIDLGADLVIGHHPHVLQGSETYKNKKIYYSLGNFYMDVMLKQANPGSGGLLEVAIEGNELKSKIMPLKVTLAEIDIDSTNEAMSYYQSLCTKIGVDSEYFSEINSICEEFWEEVYSGYYESAMTGLGTTPNFLAVRRIVRRLLGFIVRRRWNNEVNEMMLIHNIRIESHRWVVERALSNRVLK
jgi:poly-gamma-glutamate capsule biosynthesis protein CapA/YwtB (metallophosphatase superfamily)